MYDAVVRKRAMAMTLLVVGACAMPVLALGQDNPGQADDMGERMKRLEARQEAYERELAEKNAEIALLQKQLIERDGQVASVSEAGVPEPPLQTATTLATPQSGQAAATPAAQLVATPASSNEPFGQFTPGRGFTVARTSWGEIQLSVYTYLRYLNQSGLDGSYTDHFGNQRPVQQRNDFQVNKIFLYTQGWLLDPKFRYTFYVWSSAPLLGSGSNTLVAGNLTYSFNDAFILGGGVFPLPSTRSMDGQFPYWQRVDARLIADEFMRGSFTQGVWATGRLSKTLTYRAGIGNNLSAFGVSASRLDSRLDTFSGALIWMPSTGEFGPRGSFGDFEMHEELATLFSVRGTSSTEDRENQPGQDQPENTQIRLSDGVTVFTPNALAAGTTVNTLDYQMLAASAGMKYKGFYLEAEAYFRKLDNFRATGDLPVSSLDDQGAQLQGSFMAIPETLQVYANGSKIWGDFGNPWDAGIGVNWWPFKKQQFRLNGEFLYLDHSPVGSTTLPYSVGSTGFVFVTSAELKF